MGRMSTRRRLLTDLPLAELRRALRATIQAAGTDSSSADILRRAIAAVEARTRQRRKKREVPS